MSRSDFSPATRRIIFARDMGRCARCGRPLGPGANAHHRLLRSRGGMGTVPNGISLCGSGTTYCHGWAHANVKAATLQGFIVSSWDDPAMVPVVTWRGVIRLDDDGGFTIAA